MLGPLEAWHDGAPVPLGDRQQRFVLVVLLLHANRPVTPARLGEIVWADREVKLTLVRSYIKRLRAVVEGADDVTIETTPTGYLLRIGEAQLDTLRFNRLRAEAAEVRADDPRRAIALLREAVGLWRGKFLEDIDLDRVGGTEVISLDESYPDVVGDLAELELEAGDHRAARDRLRPLVRADPTGQRHAELLMRALLAGGDRAAALRVFHGTRDALAEQGMEPNPSLLALAAEPQGVLRISAASNAIIGGGDVVAPLGVAEGTGTVEAASDPPPPARMTPPAPETKVDWATDAPSDEDQLNRDSLAEVLAVQLRQVHSDTPTTSFIVHLDGAWGTGKSTLLNFLERRLGDEFTIVRFDAWRQSRLGPPWWVLLSASREAVARERNLFARGALRVAESVVRARRAGAAVTLSVFLFALVVAGFAVFVLPHVADGDAVATLAKAVTTIVATLAALWTGARVVGRTLLWDSVRGARLFEQSAPNPMDQVAHHFEWLLGKTHKPVLFFIDDLDRCPGAYVVDLLDTVQTLIRDTPSRTSTLKRSATYFIVAADGAWLRKSYEDAFPAYHNSVSLPGNSLGHLFLDKLFQLTVPVPEPSSRARATYLKCLLNVEDSSQDDRIKQEIADGQRALAEVDNEATILDIVDSASPLARDELAAKAALALVASATRAHTEHALSKFLPLLHSNPRNIKKFLNTYSVLRSVRTLEQNTVPSDVLALWTIVRVRWPSVAEHLEANPDAIRGLVEPLWASECLPHDLRDLANNVDLRAVVLHPVGGPLTANLIRQCTGIDY
ncbi:P-loop NTPase fold protein [Amycolatopsis sp. NPDC005003]